MDDNFIPSQSEENVPIRISNQPVKLKFIIAVDK